MLKIFICEDNPSARQKIADIIQKRICIEEYDMELSFSTSNPYCLLSAIKESSDTGIYFLDIVLNSDINGIELASKIRQIDPRGFIIFITMYENMWPLTFQYKVEAMDYIAKNNPKYIANHIADCLKRANELFTSNKNCSHKLFRIKIGSQIVTLPMDNVLYFEPSSSSHRVIAHTTNGTTEFYGTIKELIGQADERFLLSHRKYLVNKNHISSIDFTVLKIYFQNGETCPVSVRLAKQFRKLNFSK